ncbi:MAG: CHAT domain-containing protein, partial [Acidobacteriota bacterium]|nr:CHAT domain-containing protein [Acidobacteriota bacterium]
DLLIALGTKAVKAKHVPEAISLFEQAAAAAQKAGMPRPYADATFQLTDLFVQSGDYRSAEVRVTKGLEASRKLVDMYFLPRHIAVAAGIEMQLGKTAQANAYYDEAEDLVESMLVNVPSASVKSALIATMSRVYIGHFRLALESEHDVPEAFRILEQARGRVVADRLRARPLWKEAQPQTSPIENTLAGIQTRLLHATTAEQRKRLMQELNRADLELAPVALARYRRENSINGKPITLTKLQRSLRSDEVLLEFVLDDPQSFCLAISNNRVKPYVLEGQTKLNILIADYLAETKDPSPSSASNRVAAQKLYQALLQPLEERVKTRFIIVPDEKLNFVRFGSLVSPDGEYVVERHVTTYAPSATVLNLIKTQFSTRQGSLPLLAFGDPTAPDNQIEMGMPKGGLTRGVFDLEGASFGALPSAAAEIRAITRIVGPRSRVFLGSAATETAFKSQPLGRYRVLHFAAHAVSDQRFPDRSAVVLAADKAGDDGLLQVREIRDLHLNADLVTLSACDTGTGKLQGLDGVSSVVSAFLFAGSRAVLATAWSVDDAFTASLMTRFYNHLAAGEDIGTALQQAQLDLLKRFGDKATPYYWAGFFLSGDGNRKISFQR